MSGERTLEQVGDELQSAASRVAEWVLGQDSVPYEAFMAALEARGAVKDWTELRKEHGP